MNNVKKWSHPHNYFYKMHGTGNDFIIINNLKSNNLPLTPNQSKNLAKILCHRKFGIGADGLLIIHQIQDKYKMQIINSDGSQAKMCGNGLRCFAALLFHEQMIQQNDKILTDDGDKQVSLKLINKTQSYQVTPKYLVTLKIGKGETIQQIIDHNQKYPLMFLTTIGVPHMIIFLQKDIFDKLDFCNQGKSLQQAYNANINFCLIQPNQSIIIKTFQRGAGLTYSCGTGVSSVVYVAKQKHKIFYRNQVKAITDGGEILIQIAQNNQVIMNGPAQIICQGFYQTEEF